MVCIKIKQEGVKNKEHYWTQRESLQKGKRVNMQRKINIINVHIPNDSTSKYMKQKLTKPKGEIPKKPQSELETLIQLSDNTTRGKKN